MPQTLLTSSDLIIVGAGASGSLLAYYTLQHKPIRIALLDKNSPGQLGLAYGTPHLAHILNVPAGKMSALLEDPTNFSAWLQREKKDYGEDSFVPRAIFRQYLSETLSPCFREHHLREIQAEAVDLDHDQDTELLTVRCADGKVLHARHVVFAGGNLPFTTPRCFESIKAHHRYCENPYKSDCFRKLPSKGNLFLLGSSLTALDVILQGEASGFQGKYFLLSRHGLFPRAHQDEHKVLNSNFSLDSLVRKMLLSPRTACRALREASECEAWTLLIDSLRSHSVQIWQAWTHQQQAQFLRVLRTYWDVHRHRIPRESANTLQALESSGRLELQAGKVLEVVQQESQFSISIQPRGKEETIILQAQGIVNCTGPGSSIETTSNEFIKNLFQKGYARPDLHGLGIESSPDGQVLNREGRIQSSISTLGPLRRGQLWETTALREIREQAALLASSIAKSL